MLGEPADAGIRLDVDMPELEVTPGWNGSPRWPSSSIPVSAVSLISCQTTSPGGGGGREESNTGARVSDVIDREALTALEELGEGFDFVIDVVGEFLADGVRQVETIRGAVDTSDAGSLERAAHSLKSASASVGALRLAEMCETLEGRGRLGDLADAGKLAAALDDEFARVEVALKSEVARGSERG